MKNKIIKVLMFSIANIGVFSCLLVTQIYFYGQHDNTHSADVLIVLGAGNPKIIERRAAHAAYLWQKGYAPYMICTGGDHPNDGYRAEAEYCRKTLLEHGVPAEMIFSESESHSTQENAIHAGKIIKEHHWQSVLLVSDGYHLWRAQLIFKEYGWEVYTSSAQLTQQDIPLWILGKSLAREVLATYWHFGKKWLGLDYTDFPFT
jgi:uncharacterized SAM-binding protein YcdF (DUF218 family)